MVCYIHCDVALSRCARHRGVSPAEEEIWDRALAGAISPPRWIRISYRRHVWRLWSERRRSEDVKDERTNGQERPAIMTDNEEFGAAVPRKDKYPGHPRVASIQNAKTSHCSTENLSRIAATEAGWTDDQNHGRFYRGSDSRPGQPRGRPWNRNPASIIHREERDTYAIFPTNQGTRSG